MNAPGPAETGGTARAWRCGSFSFARDVPVVMGILNATPDSFSDGGSYGSVADAVAAGLAMARAGAAIVDVGGESTRPGSDAVGTGKEIDRVRDVVEGLASRGVCVSIDTRHAEVARAALDAGASVLNDITGFLDPRMLALAGATGAGLVVMHMQGEPRTMQETPRYGDVVAEVAGFLAARAAALTAAGVSPDRIALDPGIGFGKTTDHNLKLLRDLATIGELGFPLLVGASRKRFIGEITGVAEPRERLAGSLAVALEAVLRGALVVRVHDVAATVQALEVARAIGRGALG